jgi:hypothetical protein
MKKDMLTLKKGDKIEVTSTRMLSPTEVATITNLQKIGSSPAVKEAIQKATEPAKTK